LLAFVPMLVFYAWTDQRDVQFWDIGEMQTVPWIYGIAHPTGFPLYTMFGWLFSHAIPLGSIAWRMSFFSSVAMCAAGWFVYRIVFEETGFAWIAVGASFIFGAGSVAWSRGTRADVHPLAIALEAAAVYTFLAWRRSGNDRAFITGLALLGAALAVHPVAAFAAPAMIALALPQVRRLSRKTPALGAAAFLAPLAAYASIPLRGAVLYAQRRDPTLTIGLPPGRPFWDYAHTQTLANFIWFVSGAQFHREAGATGYTNLRVFGHTLALGRALVVHDFGLSLAALAAIGLLFVSLRKPSFGIAFALLAVSVLPFAFSYAEEADKERYALATLFAVACLAGIGGAGAVVTLTRRAPRHRQAASIVLAVLLTGVAGWHFYKARNVIEINRDVLARRYVEQVRALTPADAIVIADWTYATPLAYAAYAERSLGRRIVVAGTVDDMRGYLPTWSRHRCVVYVAGVKTQDRLALALGGRAINASLPYLFALESCRPERAL
jgi:hypothetical protein